MTPAFSRVRFVMVEPSHPGNVGSAARALKTMGFSELALVQPRHVDVQSQPEALSLASGAVDVLQRAQVYASLQEALAPVTLAFALTARDRDLGPPVCDIRQAAGLTRDHLITHPFACVAIVVGTERAGLTNEHIALCQRICHIPANPQYSSLNVAQALQLAAWELRYVLLSTGVEGIHSLASDARGRCGDEPAASEAVQAFLAHWQEALIAIKFLDPAHPKKLIPRMRHLFNRSGLSRDEIDMMRGVCTAMIASARRSE